MEIKYGLPLFLKHALALGEKLWEYEPETLAGFFTNPLELEKVLAITNFIVNDSAHDQWEIFLQTVLVLNDREASFDYIPDVTVAELAWAIYQLRMIDPILHFSTEVLRFISVLLHDEGWLAPPSSMKDLTSTDNIHLSFLLRDLNGAFDYSSVPSPEAAQALQIKDALVNKYIESHKQDLESYMRELEKGLV